jgi:hypothetical protein
MSDIFELLFDHRWWMYDPADRSLHSVVYRHFNLTEFAVWCLFGGLVLWRYARHRRSPLEVAYAAAFVLFGLTDFREAYELSSWLLWIKLANLIVLLRLRAIALRTWYPGRKLF